MNMQNNNVKMIVNLGTDPTVKSCANGRRMARFSAAAVETDPVSGKNNVKWYSVVSWGNLADVAERHLRKGKRVLLCGHLVTRNLTDKKGNIRTKCEIVATDLRLLNDGRTPAVRLAA